MNLKKLKQDYASQKCKCKSRVDSAGNKIEMRLTFEEWLDIWQQSGHLADKGCKKDQYCMSRKGDLGHYEVGNINIRLVRENTSEWARKPRGKRAPFSAEWLANMSKCKVGKIFTAEHRANLSKSWVMRKTKNDNQQTDIHG